MRRAGPVGVVVGDAVAGVAHLQDQLLDAGDVHINLLGRLLAAHHAARPERLAVADHAKLDAAAAMGLVINADPGSEPPGRPLEVEHQPRVGMGAKSVVEGPAADHERMARRRTCPPPGCPRPAWRRPGPAPRGESRRRPRAGQRQECREQNRGMQWIAQEARVGSHHGRYLMETGIHAGQMADEFHHLNVA